MIPFEIAKNIAERIRAELAAYCDRIEIAGSIRRGRPHVGDIDLVILPRHGDAQRIKERCRVRCQLVTEGPQSCIYRMFLADRTEVQLDLFIARHPERDLLQSKPGNFGTLLLCRTGSKEHNIHLVEHAKSLGLKWKPYEGVLDEDGYVIASETEEEIFAALILDFVPPEKRER